MIASESSVITPLLRSFYDRDPVTVAQEIVGCLLVRRLGSIRLVGRIVEVEAYGGGDDPASHAYRGPRPRNRSMFGPPGHLYVYRSHGIHFCANVVTQGEGIGTAVLLRALEPMEGLETMRSNRGLVEERLLCSGPGRLTQAFGIDMGHDGLDLMTGVVRIAPSNAPVDVAATTRIGISVATEYPWRFVDRNSRFLSRSLPK